jgi:hypothetical protein
MYASVLPSAYTIAAIARFFRGKCWIVGPW